MDTLIARKRLLYPQVREDILTHHLSLVEDKATLSVGTAPVPETIQRRSPACGHAGTHNERHRLSAAHEHRV